MDVLLFKRNIGRVGDDREAIREVNKFLQVGRRSVRRSGGIEGGLRLTHSQLASCRRRRARGLAGKVELDIHLANQKMDWDEIFRPIRMSKVDRSVDLWIHKIRVNVISLGIAPRFAFCPGDAL